LRDFFVSPRYKILIALLCVLLGFIIASVYSGGAPVFSQAISFITAPAQGFSASISSSVTGFFNKYIETGRVYEQNELLIEELNNLRMQLVDYNKAKHENEQLREILGVMDELDPGIIPVSATVTARDPADRFHSFSIDKGELHGIKRLDPVITAEGLVGYVTEVGKTYARVATILDVAVSVGAYDSTSRDIGIVTGTVDLSFIGRCEMQYLPRESKIAAGDYVLTSGGSFFPRDIMIGRVAEVRPSAHGTTPVAVIEPTADIRFVKNVFVIISFEGQGAP